MRKRYRVTVNGQAYDVDVEDLGSTGASPGPAAPVSVAPVAIQAPPAPVPPVAAAPAVQGPAVASAGATTIKAPMPGTILAIKVAAGQSVRKGSVLLILEAMKMENEICAPADAVVSQIRVQVGATVNTGDPMIDLA